MVKFEAARRIEEEGTSKKSVLVVSALLLIFAVWIRYSIFGFSYEPLITSEDYDKPVKVERLVFPIKKLPSGYRRLDTKVFEKRDRIKTLLSSRNLSLQVGEIEEVTIVDFKTPVGSIFEQLIIVFSNEQSAENFSGVNDGSTLQDDRIILLSGISENHSQLFRTKLKEHVIEEKRLRTKVAKLKVAGNASFCFCIDILVGSLFVVVAMFLAKYFLIIRKLEN